MYIILITFREIESEGGLFSSKVLDVEDKILRQVIFAPPDYPPDSGIHKTVLMSTNIDTLYQWKTEIPFQLWINEWRNESTTSCVNMNRSIPSGNTFVQKNIISKLDFDNGRCT